MRAKPSLAFVSVLAGALAVLSVPADAACKKFGFTVNDYGKEGPTNDAKNLLDKHIAEWAAQNGVAEYQTGKKSVSCELFLDVILFDEHTCTASATVCWGAGVKPNNKTGEQTAEATADDAGGAAPPAPVRKAEALGIAPQQAAATAPSTTETPAPTAPAAAAEAAAPAAPTAPVEQAAAPAETPAATPAVQTTAPADQAATPPAAPANKGAAVETGALQAGAGLAAAPAAEKPKAAAVSEKDRAAAAAAAASAAAAAERAAAAAETAANAAKEAAAAAVAASAASKGTATVPPLDQASGAKAAHNE